MLQWMGGSRRKVNTSRRSTQKRQKQYFEQRKWQDQQKKDGSKSFFEEKSACNQQAKKSRSLDILSLLNLSTGSGVKKSNVQSERHSYVRNAVTPDNQMLQRFPVTQIKEAICVDALQLKEGTSSRSQDYAACQKKASAGATGGHDGTLCDTVGKVYPPTISTCTLLSIIDILGDDGPNGKLESSTHEGHVAFSIEGLGKVEAVTPLHSPQVPGRPLSDGRSSPPRARRTPLSSDYLNRGLAGIERELDSMMVDVELSFCVSPLYRSSSSRETADLLGSTEQKLLDARWFSGDNHFTDLYTFENDEIFSKSKETIWKANSSYPLNESFHEDCGSPRKSPVYHFDAGSTDCWNNQSCVMRDFSFKDCYYWGSANSLSARNYGKQATYSDDSYHQKQRVNVRAKSEFNIIDSPTPYSTHFKPGNIRDFIFSDGERFSTGCKNPHFMDHIDHAERAWFATADGRDNLSLLSEESCSSTAVVGDIDSQQKMNSNNKRRSQDVSDGSKQTKYCEKLFTRGRSCNMNDIHQGKEMNELTKLPWPLNQSSAKPAHNHPAFYEKRSDQNNDALREARCDPEESNSRFRSFYQTSGFNERVSTCSDYLIRDVHSEPEPKIEVDSLQNLKGSMKYPGEYAPSCFKLEPMTFELASPRCAYRGLFQDSKKGFGTEDSLHALGSLGKLTESSVRGGSKRTDGDKGVNILTFDSSQFAPKIEVSGAYNGLLSGKEKSMDDASGSVNKCSNCEGPKERTPEMEDRTRSFNYSGCAGKTSSSIEITVLKWDQDCLNKNQDTQSSLRCQEGDEVTKADRSPLKERRLIKQQSPSVHQNGQVMMLEAVSFNFYVCSF